mgnify:CR=1 FL=1
MTILKCPEIRFKNEDDKNMAKNLRITTLFSSDEYLSKALFNNKPNNSPFSRGSQHEIDAFIDERCLSHCWFISRCS